MFHSGAYQALRNRTLDMNVLVSLGVLVAYLFSLFATLFAPEVEDQLRRSGNAGYVCLVRSLDGDA